MKFPTPVSGPAMLLKSFGISPELIQEKVAAAEKILNEYSRVMQDRLKSIDDKLLSLDQRLLTLHELIAQNHGDTIPAGVSPEFYTQEKKPYGQ